MLTDCHLSFRFVKKSVFRALINNLRSDIRVLERIKIKSLCDAFILKIEDSLLDDLSLSTRFSLTLDVWINKQQHSFLRISVYYITDSWQFKEKLLEFKSFVDRHTNWQMINVVLKLLVKYSIDDRLLTITTDNALFNEKLRKHFSMLLLNTFNIKWNHSKDTIACMIHVMQLMLNAIFKALKVSANKNNDEDASLRTNTFNLSNTIFYFNTIVKINTCHTNLSH